MWLILLLVLSVLFIVVATSRLKLHPFIVLLMAAFGYGILCGKMTLAEVVRSVNDGFGGTIGQIGIVILAGAIIGSFMDKSGGAYKLADRIVKLIGKKEVPLTMGILGYIVSTVVFCDSGFVILSPLCKALSRKAKISLAASAVALSMGLYATHTMFPPTPGPIAAAGILKADIGLVIMWGALVSAVSMLAGWLFAVKFAAKEHIEPTLDPDSPDPDNLSADAPSATHAVMPILIPILLIVLRSLNNLPAKPFGQSNLATFLDFLGQPSVALLIGVFIAFTLPKKLTTEMVSTSGWVGKAVLAAATIIIITASGGAFGTVLKNSGIGDFLGAHLGKSVGLSIWLPFIISAALKTSQGSSTVAIITTASICAPLLGALGLDTPTAKALTVVAIGAGSMVVSHANDSYFWVVTGFSGMSIKQGYKLQTLGTLVVGSAAAITLWLITLFVL
jgi:GntP family gluconate:H+ symporter